MKTLIFVFLSILLSQSIIAQSLEVDSNQIKKIDGFFHPFNKTFVYEKSTPHPVEDAYIKYYAEDFIANRAIVHRQELFYTKTYNKTTKQNEEIKHTQSSYGLIDTLGNIIMPCTYSNLRRIPYDSNSRYFIIYTKDSINLINCLGKKLFTLPLICNRRTSFGYFCSNTNYLRIVYCSEYYLFDIEKECFVLPSNHIKSRANIELENEEYQIVNWNNRYAIFCNIPYTLDFEEIDNNSLSFDLYGSNINYIVYDLLKKEYSSPHKLAGLYNDSLVYFQDSIDSSWLTNNVKAPTNIYGYDYIEAFPENPFTFSFNQEFHPWDKTYKDYLLVSNDGKYGIISFDNHILIPIIYDNIYLIDSTHFWLKKNELWAICDMSHKLLTDFEFIDIDKMNAVNFTNFMYYTRLTPTIIGKDFHRFVSAHDADISSLSNKGGLLCRFENTHSYFSRFWENYYNSVFFAKKEDGFHLILITEGVNVLVSPKHYDNVFLASYRYEPGFQIGNKYGYLFDKIDYERIMIDLDYHKVYKFYGSYDKRIYISRELIVEDNYIVGYKTEKKYRKKRLGKYNEHFWPY